MANKPSLPPPVESKSQFDQWIHLLYAWLADKIDGFVNLFATVDFVVGTSTTLLGAERVATDTISVDVDIGTAGQIKFNVIDEYIQDLAGALIIDSVDLDFTYSDPTPSITAILTTTGVTAASYGSASAVATFTVDAKGRLSAAATVTIAITASQVSDFTEAAQDAALGALVFLDSSTIDVTYNDAGNTISLAVIAGGVDHGGLAGLADDDHTQYALLLGRSGGQALIGGTGSGNILDLQSTSNATKGGIRLGVDDFFIFDEHASAPGTPAAGKVALYAKADGHMYQKDDAGTETDLTAAGSGAFMSDGEGMAFAAAHG